MNKEPSTPKTDIMDTPLPMWIILLMPVYIGILLGVFLFPVAKDWLWLEAWLFVISFSIILTIGYAIINKTNPRVLRNRMKTKKEGLTAATKKSAGSDRFIMPIMSVAFFSAMLWPAFEHRMGWSSMPFWFKMVGLVITNLGSIIIMVSMYQNAHASKILDINQGQKLIDSGLYSSVRHPLYSGAILMMLGVPVALGSWWGLLPGAIAAFSLIWRIHFEEEMLIKGMEGYVDYQKRVPYKIIPGIY